MADLDAEGGPEIAVVTAAGDLLVIEGATGEVLRSIGIGGPAPQGPIAADLDGDGGPDLALATRSGSLVAIAGRDGRVFWRKDLGSGVEAPLAATDLDLDGAADVLAGTAAGSLVAFSGRTGEPLWRHEAGAEIRAAAAADDVDGDGALEVVLAARNEVWVLDGATGAFRWKVRASGAVWARPALGDLDGDGRLDLVVGSQDGTLAAVSPGPGAWTMSVALGSAVVAGPNTVRSADGKADRVLLGCEDQSLALLDARSGRILWRRSYQPTGSEIPLADLDGDGVPEILVQGRDRKFLALSLATGVPAWSASLAGWATLPALGADFDGDGARDVAVATDEPAAIVLSGKDGSILFRHETIAPPVLGLAARDVTGDGRPEIVVASTDGRLTAYDGPSGKAVWQDPGPGGDIVIVVLLAGEGGHARSIAAVRPRRVDLLEPGSSKCSSSISLMGSAAAAIGVPDRDLDGVEDLVVALATGEVLLASGSSGAILWRASTGGAAFAVLFDSMGEGDVLVACHGGEIHGLSSRTGHLLWTGRAPSALDAAPGLLLPAGDGPSLLVAGTTAGEVVVWSRRESSRPGTDGSSAYVALQRSEAALATQGGDAALIAPARAYLERWPGSVWTPHARLLFARGLLASGDSAGGEKELRAALAAGLRSRSLVSTVLRHVPDPSLLGELAISAPARLVEALGRDLPDGKRQELAKLRLAPGAGASSLERAALLALAADWGQVADVLRREIDAGPAGTELLAAAGHAAYRAGRFADAESLLSRALAKRHRPAEADYWSRRAALLSDPASALPAAARILWDLDEADRETFARRLASWAKGAREEDVQRLLRSLAGEAPEFASRALGSE